MFRCVIYVQGKAFHLKPEQWIRLQEGYGIFRSEVPHFRRVS